MIDDAASDQDLGCRPEQCVLSFSGMTAEAKPWEYVSTTTAADNGGGTMPMTKRKPATIGEVLREDFMQPLGLTQGALAEAMGVQRKHVNELCNDRRKVTAATALILARVFGNSPNFWLNVQQRTLLWEAMNSPRERERIKRARRVRAVA